MTKHNSHQIYIREAYKPIWIRFLRLIKEDSDFQKLRAKNHSGLISIAIMQLIYDYILEKDPEFKLEFISSENDEKSNQIDNQETQTYKG